MLGSLTHFHSKDEEGALQAIFRGMTAKGAAGSE